MRPCASGLVCLTWSWIRILPIARDLKRNLQSLRVVLPDGQLLASICSANPLAMLVDVNGAIAQDQQIISSCRTSPRSPPKDGKPSSLSKRSWSKLSRL